MNKLVVSIASLLLCAPLAASAVEGWVVADISLQAGPDPAYPSIEQLPAGTPVTIAGCVDGWTWCDVITQYDGDRGWVPGTFLQEEYSGQRVYIIDYGARIGIPVVSFSVGLYWDRYYHNRPFYAKRQEWETRTIRPQAPPRPAHVTATGPIRTKQATTTQQPAAAPQAAPATRTQQPQPTLNERKRDAQRTERPSEPAQPAEQREAKPTKPDPTRPSDAAPQMKPQEAPRPEPPKQQPPSPQAEHAQPPAHEPKPKQEAPKPKDELRKPDKKKDDDDSGGGKDLR